MVEALVLLSGGLDSTVVLALALSGNRKCRTLSFDYGQNHLQELTAAKRIAEYYSVPHQIVKIDPAPFTGSSLTSSLPVPKATKSERLTGGGIPSTYVPGRNTLFLSYALCLSELHQAEEIHFGPNKLDLPCYPDCRPAYLNAFQNVMNLATKQAVEGNPPRLITPLLQLNKTEIIRLGLQLKAPLETTWSCYSPVAPDLPCSRCLACLLRQKGFEEALDSTTTFR